VSLLEGDYMNFLLKLILNRMILSILIIFLFALDYNFITFNPNQVYSLNRPPVEAQATEYYEIQFGEPILYIEITYFNNSIHLVPTTDSSVTSLVLNQPLVPWYYYALSLALANIIPFRWFFKKDNHKQNKKMK